MAGSRWVSATGNNRRVSSEASFWETINLRVVTDYWRHNSQLENLYVKYRSTMYTSYIYTLYRSTAHVSTHITTQLRFKVLPVQCCDLRALNFISKCATEAGLLRRRKLKHCNCLLVLWTVKFSKCNIVCCGRLA